MILSLGSKYSLIKGTLVLKGKKTPIMYLRVINNVLRH